LDDSLVLFSGRHLLTIASGVLALLTLFLMLVVYGLMGLTPIVPKRVFLPVLLLTGLGLLVVFPTVIYCRQWILQLDWLLSLLQVVLVLGICYRLRGGGRFRWSVVEVRHLGCRPFSWLNLSGFLLLNLFVLLPAVVAYLALCASLAIGHFTDGFLALRPGGLILQARKYARADGKTILLFPMSHIAETDFYQAVSQSVASNAVVLLEGVTDSKNLLTNNLSYRRAAKSLGLAEQHDDLNIRQGELVRADVDVQEFSASTIGILNLVALVHSRGLNATTLPLLLECSPPPDVEQQLFADLLLKRNEHLLKELRARLPEADVFVIPWGAAHMPGLAREIQKIGFRLVETREYVSIRFGPNRHKGASSP
jgi:TRAP-type mannitol/chloroaromatic compound transport system permease small subunit